MAPSLNFVQRQGPQSQLCPAPAPYLSGALTLPPTDKQRRVGENGSPRLGTATQKSHKGS